MTKGHSPVIAELKAGVVQIFHEPVSTVYCGAASSAMPFGRVMGELYIYTQAGRVLTASTRFLFD